jgi:hypothetical protein
LHGAMTAPLLASALKLTLQWAVLTALPPPPPFTPPPFASSPIFLVLVPRELGSFIQSMEGRGTMLVAWDMEQAEHVSRTQMCRMLGRPQLS